MAKNLNHIICFDYETGGLECKKHAATQIAMEVLDPFTLKPIASYDSYILPYSKPKQTKRVAVIKKSSRSTDEENMFEYTDSALNFTNTTMKMIEDKGVHVEDVMSNMVEMFIKANPNKTRNYKPILLGQNVQFDIGFLHQMAERCKIDLSKYLDGDKDYYGNFHPTRIDTLDLSKQYFANDSKVESHKLGLMSDKLGVELVDAHEAAADVRATSEMFKIYMENMRSSKGSSKDSEDRSRSKFHFNF